MSMRDEIMAAADAMPTPVLLVPTPELPQHDGRIGVTRVSQHALAAYWKDCDEFSSIPTVSGHQEASYWVSYRVILYP